MRWLVFVVLALAHAGCADSNMGSNDGAVPGSARLVDLSDDEYRQLCERWGQHEGHDAATIIGGHPFFVCMNGTTVRVPTVDECVMFRLNATDFPMCPATVDDWRACAAATPDHVSYYCSEPSPEACRLPPTCVYSGVAQFFPP